MNVCTERQRGMCSAVVSGMSSSFARPFMRAARVCASAIRSPPGRSRPGSPPRRAGQPMQNSQAGAGRGAGDEFCRAAGAGFVCGVTVELGCAGAGVATGAGEARVAG